MGWPGPAVSGVHALSHLVTLSGPRSPHPRKGDPGRGPSTKGTSRTGLAQSSWGRLQVTGRGQRGQSYRQPGSPEVPGAARGTLGPQATVVLGLAGSWHACPPALQRPCHGARVAGLGRVAEPPGRRGLGRRAEVSLRLSRAADGGRVLCSQGGRWALQQAALRVDPQPPPQESSGSSTAVGEV